MAVPDTFKYMLVVIAAMIVYRFVHELSAASKEESPTAAPGGAEKQQEQAPRAPKSPAPASGAEPPVPIRRQHHLRKDQVLIEYCTS